jgi:hypothetical protein
LNIFYVKPIGHGARFKNCIQSEKLCDLEWEFGEISKKVFNGKTTA